MIHGDCQNRSCIPLPTQINLELEKTVLLPLVHMESKTFTSLNQKVAGRE
jgi:hypothetical protein